MQAPVLTRAVSQPVGRNQGTAHYQHRKRGGLQPHTQPCMWGMSFGGLNKHGTPSCLVAAGCAQRARQATAAKRHGQWPQRAAGAAATCCCGCGPTRLQ